MEFIMELHNLKNIEADSIFDVLKYTIDSLKHNDYDEYDIYDFLTQAISGSNYDLLKLCNIQLANKFNNNHKFFFDDYNDNYDYDFSDYNDDYDYTNFDDYNQTDDLDNKDDIEAYEGFSTCSQKFYDPSMLDEFFS